MISMQHKVSLEQAIDTLKREKDFPFAVLMKHGTIMELCQMIHNPVSIFINSATPSVAGFSMRVRFRIGEV